jgi:nucleoside-diphosphate-sugar epimerase
MNILITGGTGFIGRYLLKHLTEQGHFCRCLVRKNSNIDLIKKFSNIEFFYGDISHKESLTNICKGIDIVINSAGILGKWDSNIEQIRPVNAYGILNLSDEIEKNNVGFIVHLSAGGVTGPVKGPSANETYTCQPISPYEQTKLEGERNAIRLWEKYKYPIVVARPTFTYGPSDPHKLPMFKTIKRGHFVFIGSGQSTNHPVYIDDLVSGIMLLIEKRPVGEIFILGGPRPVSKKELVNTIGEELGVKTNFLNIPIWLASSIAVIMVYFARILNFEPVLTPSRIRMMADNWGYTIGKAQKELGYSPQIDLKEGIALTVKSYEDLGWL